MYVVAIGDAFNGLILYGPFSEIDDAQDWAEDHRPEDTEYSIVQLQKPSAS